MKILSPPGLHYPITIGELARKRDDEVKRSDPLFTYFYETTVEEGDKWGETKDVKKRFPVKFEASLDGAIKEWFINQGSVIHRSGYVAAPYKGESC
jgi:RNA polymerase II subunit A-like phosphatase